MDIDTKSFQYVIFLIMNQIFRGNHHIDLFIQLKVLYASDTA